jgi:5S rRNA maturation endonuclease (ribonuclease M5)
VNRQALDDLKRQIPLMGYLQAHDWHPLRPLSRGRWMGLCPLHEDRKPSFLVDPNQDLFYCYGCGRGGDVIRFAELYHQVKFSQALVLLHRWRGAEPLLHEAARVYQIQLHRHSEAVAYLHHRGVRSPEVIEQMHIGYAPGGCLRSWLTQLGHCLPALRQSGLVTGSGYDAYVHRIVFPLEGNLYGRSLSASAPPHRFLPGSKGGLYSWAQAQCYPEVILVEGLFDYAVLWEAGFRNVTCSLGTHLNARQLDQICDAPRTVYLAFDADCNGCGQQAAQHLSRKLFGNEASRFASSACRRGTIPTASSRKAATRASSKHCWRPPCHEIPRRSPAHHQSSTQPVPHRRANHRPRGRLDQPLSGSGMPPPCSPAHPPQLRSSLTALSPLVGKCSPQPCDLCGQAHGFDPAGLRTLPIRPPTRIFRLHH